MQRILATAVLFGSLAGFPARAASSTYALVLPESAAASYEVPFRVDHAGTLIVEARWDGARIVSFRIDGPGIEGAAARRSGPSPQRMEVEVGEAAVARGGEWTLTIRAPAAREAANGTLSLRLPDPPEVVEARERAAVPPPPPPPKPDPWTIARVAPAGASGSLSGLFDGIESLRGLVFPKGSKGTYDACGWQEPAVRWLSETRDRVANGGAPPLPETRAVLARVARAVGSVEAMRTSDDPILSGPVPEDPPRSRAWLAVRRDELRVLERELDLVGETLRAGYAPELDGFDWPARLAACLTACERHFEERVRVGRDDATNRDLAEAQWPKILAAARALERLSAFDSGSRSALP